MAAITIPASVAANELVQSAWGNGVVTAISQTDAELDRLLSNTTPTAITPASGWSSSGFYYQRNGSCVGVVMALTRTGATLTGGTATFGTIPSGFGARPATPWIAAAIVQGGVASLVTIGADGVIASPLITIANGSLIYMGTAYPTSALP